MSKANSEFSSTRKFVFENNAELDSLDGIVCSDLPLLSGVDGVTITELVWSNLHLKENMLAFVRKQKFYHGILKWQIFVTITQSQIPDPLKECSETGKKLTYGEVFRQSRSFAAALMQRGLGRGQVVTVVLPNVVEFPVILFGILDAGQHL